MSTKYNKTAQLTEDYKYDNSVGEAVYNKGLKLWMLNGKPLQDSFITYDKDRNIKVRLNRDGSKDYFVRDKAYQSPYTYRKQVKAVNVNRKRYIANHNFDLTFKGLFDKSFVKPIYNKNKHKYALKIADDAVRKYPDPQGPAYYDEILSNYFNSAVNLGKHMPQYSRLAQWAAKYRPLAETEKVYTVNNQNDKDSYVLYYKGAPIITNKHLLNDVVTAADKQNLPRDIALSLAYGESTFGTIGGFVDNYKNISNNKRHTVTSSQIINHHRWQSGADYPAISELAYAGGKQNIVGRAAFPNILDYTKYNRDAYKNRVDKLLQESDSLFNSKPDNALEDFFILYKNNPNKINPKNAVVNNGKSYKQKVEDNINIIKQIKGLEPLLEGRLIEKFGGVIPNNYKRRLSSGGKYSY